MKKHFSILAALAVAGAMGTTTERAEATVITCNVARVGWATGNSGTVQIHCGGSFHYGYGSGSCPLADLESRRAWVSLAQAAQLSGRQVALDYTLCGSNRALSNVTLL